MVEYKTVPTQLAAIAELLENSGYSHEEAIEYAHDLLEQFKVSNKERQTITFWGKSVVLNKCSLDLP